ncbi:MAG: septum site-determining protein MinC [Defluviitaleaceae bacterium]|nr:septum site-determining protein MinC [Defluviitaleaceae bacterium]
MATKQIVTIKGQNGVLGIVLDPKADFEDIKESLRKKTSQGRDFFNTDMKIMFKGRELDEYSEKVLIDIITEETDREIIFVQDEGYAAPPRVQRTQEQAPEPEPPTSPSRLKYRETATAYYHTGLRSGQSVKHKGSVVVIGDANPGSEIVADGNVIVLGALKGMAHAGAAGDSSCFVSALTLQPTQLRIAKTISYVPAPAGERAGSKKAGASADKAAENPHKPAYAYIKEGQVFVMPL